ncbi:MAG: class I SAM-dependent methyltransferase [Actinomycetota bacterium]
MPSVADLLGPVFGEVVGGALPVSVRFWDGSVLDAPGSSATILFRSPDALRRIAYSPGELGLGRAYVAGDLDIEGDIFAVLALRDRLGATGEHIEFRLRPAQLLRTLGIAHKLGALGRPLPSPPEEARLRARLHSRSRDAAAISHHYDVSNDFYRLVLGPTMTYSCAYFPDADTTLDQAQAAKYDLICKKLGLGSGMRLLDVGCGWGGMIMHAAPHYGVRGVGITISRNQADLAAKRVAEAGLGDLVEIRFQDYRDVADGPYDAISSIGMFEHVGLARIKAYFSGLFDLLRPGGRLLNHAISRPHPGRPGFDKRSFITRYVFPDGELHEVGTVVSAMQEHGFEVRDVESLREHYARTLRHWVANLEANWDEAVRLAGLPRAKTWRLYMAGSAVNFEANRTTVHQSLGVRPHESGVSAMPATRRDFV